MVEIICIYNLENLFYDVKFLMFKIINNIKENSKINSSVCNKKIYKGFNHPAKKYEIQNPFSNRSKIAGIAKEAKGVYIFEVEDKNLCYVGSSINLYNRVI
jgi:hypothetical protein